MLKIMARARGALAALLPMLTLLGALPTPAVAAGDIAWVERVGGGTEETLDVAVDGGGSAYLVGWTRGTLSGQTAAGGYDAAVWKVDAAGVAVWARQFGSPATDTAGAAAVDAGGNLYVAGTTEGTLGGQRSRGGMDAFVRKYDGAGNALWTRQLGTGAQDGLAGVAADGGGNLYVVGFTWGTLPGQTRAGRRDAYMFKLDPAGVVLWGRQFGTAADDEALAVAADAAGNAYIAGTAGGALPGQLWAGGVADGFVRKYGPGGDELWTRQFGTADSDAVQRLAVDGSSHVYATGLVRGALPGQTSRGNYDAFVRRYDSSGNEAWTRQFGTPDYDSAGFVASDGSGGVFVAGWTQQLVSSPTFRAPFLRKYDQGGNELWARPLGGWVCDRVELVRGLALGPTGAVYLGLRAECPADGAWLAQLFPSRLAGGFWDGFSRMVASGWGSDYVVPRSAASDLAVTGREGTMRVPGPGSANQRTVHVAPLTPGAGPLLDLEASVRVRTDRVVEGPDGARAYAFLVARRNAASGGATCEYRGRLSFTGVDGGQHPREVRLAASKVVGTNELPLGTEVAVRGREHAANEYVNVRMRVEGTSPTTIRLQAWWEGVTEPSGWAFTATDDEPCLRTAGAYGLIARLGALTSNAPFVFGFDDYRVVTTRP